MTEVMNCEAIKARQFWQGVMDDAVAKMSDSEAVGLAQAFAEPRAVAVLQLTNHSVQRASGTAKILEVSHKWAILNNTILDKIQRPKERKQKKLRTKGETK